MQKILPKLFTSKNNMFHLELRLRNSRAAEPPDRHVSMNFLTNIFYGSSGLKPGWEGHVDPVSNLGAYSSGWLNDAIEVVTEAKRWLETSGYFEKRPAGKCKESWELKEEYFNGKTNQS